MEKLYTLISRSTMSVLTATLLGFGFTPGAGISRAHAADDYLKAIEAEGDQLEFLGQAKKEQEMLMRSTPPRAKPAPKPKAAAPVQAPKQTARASATAPAPSTSSPDSVTQPEFEKALRGSFPGSYALYSLMEPKEKESVFREYKEADREGTIRFLPAVTKIISLSGKNKSR